VDVRTRSIASAQKDLGMKEGFDVGLEMSGNPQAFRDMLANMCHGGKIAMLGIPSKDLAIDWNTVIFNMLTIKGIYGREMYETWYKMTVMLQSGLDISSVITHRFHFSEYQKGFEVMLVAAGRRRIALSAAEAAAALNEVGSDPGFFELDDDGTDLSEGDES
jgi:threonine 3-dehydrogenase